MGEDARYLSPGALDALRRRVMRVVSQGMSQAKAAHVFGVSRQSVNGWYQRWREGGLRALRSRPRGRPPVARLKPYQAATVVRLITDRCPDQLKMPFVLWTREAVRDLLARRCNVRRFLWSTQHRPEKVRSYFRHPASVTPLKVSNIYCSL